MENSNIDVLIGPDSESRSIKNQIDILTSYANEHGLEIKGIYADYHKSGSSMNRPEMNRLLNDAHLGKIDTILVKDLSRFGRNYIEVGEYVDKVFPEYGIRFISVNDGFDSTNYKDDLTIALKSYLNNLYLKDISKKIRKSTALRAETEALVSNKYGYIIENKKISIDPESSKVIVDIFNQAINGKKPIEIKRYLESKKILTPSG